MIKLLTLLVAMCALAAPRAGFAASDTLPAAVDNASAIGLAADVPLTVLGAMRQLLHSKRGGKRHSHHKVTKSKKLRNKKAKGKKTVKKSVKGKKKASTKQASKKVNSKKNASKKQASKKNSGKKQASKKQSGGKKPSVLTPAVTAMAKDIRFIGDWNQNEGGKNYNGPFELPEGMVVQTTLPCELTEVRAEISQDQNDQKFVTLTVTNTYESVAECGFPVNASIVHCARLFPGDTDSAEVSAALNARSGTIKFSGTLDDTACAPTPGPVPKGIPDPYKDAEVTVDVAWGCGTGAKACMCTKKKSVSGGVTTTVNTCKRNELAAFTLGGKKHKFVVAELRVAS